jgi:hypothetical protein
MTSIFDLKTNVNELSSSNEGTARMEYDQHPPTRDVQRIIFQMVQFILGFKPLDKNGGFRLARTPGFDVN